MATEIEMTPAREPGQAPLLVTRLGGQQRVFPVGAQVRGGRDPTLELVSVNPLVSRQCHGLITPDQGGATYVDQARRRTILVRKQPDNPPRITKPDLDPPRIADSRAEHRETPPLIRRAITRDT